MEAALAKLQTLESETEVKLKGIDAEFRSHDKEFRASQDRLFKRRQELVSGKAVPTSEELAGFDAASDSSSAGHGSAGSKGVPNFWLNVLCNQDTIAEEISSRDKLALSYCTSIKAVHPAAGGPATLEMSFSANPFFTNNLLRRCLGDAEAKVREVTSDIQWKDTAHKLTVKEVKKGGGGGGKKGKKGGKGKGADDGAGSGAVKLKPCSSFFSFFLPDSSSSSKGAAKHLHDPTALPEDDEDEDDDEEAPVKSAKAERDELLMGLLLDEVLPRATHLYLAGPLQALSDEDDEEGGYQVVHGAVGSHADLPGPVQALLAALRHNQQQLDELQQQRQQQRDVARQQGNKLRQELGQKRRAVLLPDGGSSSSSPAVPRFWLRVLRSADTAALAISSRDAAVLSCLADVRFSLTRSSDGSGSSSGAKELHGKLELEFLPNRHLSSSCTSLVKDYSFELGPGGEPYLLASRVAAAPAWAGPELDPTHKKGKDGKARPASSFFQLFKQGGGKYAFNLAGNEREVQDEANELEVELLMELHSNLLLRAGSIYSSLAAEGWLVEDSEAGDQAAWAAGQQADESSDEEDDNAGAAGSDDEEEAAHRAAARRAKAKAQGGYKVTKAGVLIALVVLMLLAELFVFLDMAGWFRTKR